MQVSFETDAGRTKEINEDNLFIDEDIGLFIVADGIGGHNAGEVASEIAVKVISSTIKEKIANRNNINMSTVIKESISKANDEIFKMSRGNIGLNGMGSTIILALLNKRKLHIANVGDSRAYLIRNNTINQLTEDHTLVSTLVRMGKITKEEAKIHPRRNVITNALGVNERVESYIKSTNIRKSDYILLCTDGLTDMLDDEEIRAIVVSKNNSIDEKCKTLVRRANERDGKDNVTVILIWN